MASLNLDEVRLPQEGRLLLPIGAQSFNLRLATLPILDGEAMTIGLQQRPPDEAMRFALEDLGLEPQALEKVKEWLNQPYGLILVAGPLGSGKDSTLQALTAHLNTPDRKVVVFGDPVEMVMPGALQVKTQPAAGASFYSSLRSALTQDPDIIVLSEVTDLATLEILAKTALTGHMVLSTLSTPSVAQTIEEIYAIGLEPFILSAMLVGVVAQRLVRRNCSACLVEDQPNPILIERAREWGREGGYEMPAAVSWKRGSGCSRCRQMGLLGRVALYEAVSNTDEFSAAIINRAGAEELERIARAQNARSLFAEGLREAVEGRISLDQLFRTMALPALG